MLVFKDPIQTLYELKDDYQWLRVVAWPDGCRYLFFEDTVQGAIDPSNLAVPPIEYVALMFSAARKAHENPGRILVGGLGGGALTHASRLHWPHARVETVEINEDVLKVAEKYFFLPAEPDLQLNDLRSFLEDRSLPCYDQIFIDCYDAVAIPPRLLTREFMHAVSANLNDRGTAVFNLWKPSCNQLCSSQLTTMRDIFKHVGYCPCSEDANLVVIAHNRPFAAEGLEFLQHGDRNLPVIWNPNHPLYTEILRDGEVIDDAGLADLYSRYGIFC